VTKRLEQLATYQQERVEMWQNEQNLLTEQLLLPIHIGNSTDNDIFHLLESQSGSAESSQENLQSVIQTLLEIGRMGVDEFEIAFDEYLSAIDRAVVEVALRLLGREDLMIFERLVQRLELSGDRYWRSL
jgi:delta-aminolevulinic acid dehydratase/porphobilinogen synthase